LRVTEHPALVISTGKNAAWVSLEGEREPRLAQLRRMTGKRFMPVPGDLVAVRILEDEKAVVERIEPRSFTLERRTAGGQAKTMAANVDTLVTVTSLAQPPPRLITLDQLLAFAELSEIGAIVVLTKPDLAPPGLEWDLRSLYRALEYATLVVNPKDGINIDGLHDAIVGRRSLLSGVSGVGKSSIFRALGGEANVAETSRFGLGRQTTSAARLFRLEGGFLIDSPGVNEFGLGELEASELVQGFREMREPALQCRFTDCTHLREPGCAIRQAVDEGSIPASRYESYTKILTEPV
jgi:ribosome biogenesis GTPase / thiamine phosphate phosphatase